MSKAMNTLALLGAGMSGYLKGREQEEERDRLRADRAWQEELRARQRKEFEEADTFKASMRAVAAPTSVESGEVYQPTVDDEGNAMPANPTAGTYKVAGQRYADEAAATKARDTYNSPLATMRRQVPVLSGAGRTGEAVALAKQADDFEANTALKEAGSLLMQGGWASVPQVYARYNDGIGARVTEDGKGGATVTTFDEKTGKETGSRTYKDLPHLFASIAGRFDPSKWVADEQRRNTEAEGTRRWEAEQGVRQQNADSQDLVRAAQAEAAAARAQAAMERAQRGANGGKDAKVETPDSTFDSKTATDIAKDMVKKEADEAVMAGKKMSGDDVARRVDEIVLALKQTHTNRFVAAQVQRVLTVAQSDPSAYAQEYGKALKVLPQSELARMGFKPPVAAGAAAQAAAPKAAPAAPAAVAPAPAAAPAPAPAASMLNTSGQDKALQAIDSRNRAALDGLAQQVIVAKQQLSAAAKSGDPAALANYARAVTDATMRLKDEAAKRLGNGAHAYIQSLAL